MISLNKVKTQAKLLAKQDGIKLKEAFELLAQQANHKDWKSYKDSLDIDWYAKHSPFLNQWFAHYDEASKYLQESGGYLLSYKGQYFIAQKEYITHLGFDPENHVWQRINYDATSSKALNLLKKYL
ncbi:MAG: hypothetical protein KC646_00775 [Candidatus Cloacimonetes bacterium]|nr:hypothetical protein [Candidatus Cloacimonadota bacterium]